MQTPWTPHSKAGGPAFPVEMEIKEGGTVRCAGMSLRDWFAGQALYISQPHNVDLGALAEQAYAIADAMLAEREKKNDTR